MPHCDGYIFKQARRKPSSGWGRAWLPYPGHPRHFHEHPRTLIPSPVESHPDHRTVEAQLLHLRPRLELVVHITPATNHRAPRGEAVADTAEHLPRQIGLSGADVGVVGNRPLVVGTEGEPSLHADHRVPVRLVDRRLPRAARPRDGTDVGGEAVAQLFLEVEEPGTREHVQHGARRVDRGVLAGERPESRLDPEVDVARRARRNGVLADLESGVSIPGAADIEVDEVGEDPPASLARFERAHEREVEAVEDRVIAHRDRRPRASGESGLPADVGEVTVGDGLELPRVGDRLGARRGRQRDPRRTEGEEKYGTGTFHAWTPIIRDGRRSGCPVATRAEGLSPASPVHAAT